MKHSSLLLALLLGLTGLLRATTVVPMSVEELTSAAETVVEARALQSWSQWNPQHTIIFTYTRFQVLKTLKGTAADQIVVKQPGGVVDGYGQKVPGVRQFKDDETTALFLRSSAAGDGSQVIVGLMQGNFRVYQARSGDTAVTNGIRGVTALEGRSLRAYTGSAMTLKNLESRVQGAQTR